MLEQIAKLCQWVRMQRGPDRCRRRGVYLLLLFLLTTLSSGCSVQAPANQTNGLTVSAAVSLKDALIEIGSAFERHNHGVKVDFNFAASGELRQQIESGASVDVFAAAGVQEVETLSEKGLLLADSRVGFIGNELVLVAPVNSTEPIAGFASLAQDQVLRIALGNPATVPAGRYAQEVLAFFQLTDKLGGKLILAENARQVLDYVARGEVDAGLVYTSDAQARSAEVKVIATAPAGSHQPIVYPMAVVQGTRHEQLAREFLIFLQSSEGRTIFKKYGFKV